jgi:large subunit ribosomal protein L9
VGKRRVFTVFIIYKGEERHMKVILQKDIPNLGDAGDIKDVAAGYVRNYLLPRKLVIIANESSKRAVEHQEKLIKIKKDKRKKQSEKVAEGLDGMELKVPANVGEEGKLFGSVTSMDIAKQLNNNGYGIDKRKIMLENPIKHTGEYEISIKLDDGITAKIKVVVGQE